MQRLWSRIAAGVLFVVTLFLILSTALPKWKTATVDSDMGQVAVSYGLWQGCASLSDAGSEQCQAYDLSFAPEHKADMLRAARAFSIIAVLASAAACAIVFISSFDRFSTVISPKIRTAISLGVIIIALGAGAAVMAIFWSDLNSWTNDLLSDLGAYTWTAGASLYLNGVADVLLVVAVPLVIFAAIQEQPPTGSTAAFYAQMPDDSRGASMPHLTQAQLVTPYGSIAPVRGSALQ